jgi:hydroxymethylbilane synthase
MSSRRTFRIATRRSKMALVQTDLIIEALKKVAPEHDYVPFEVVADGDYDKFKGDLKKLGIVGGGKGAFVKALEAKLLSKEADMAMHSMKDVPGDVDLPEGLAIPAMLERHDVRDAVVCRVGQSLSSLPEGSKIGSSSVRRAAQMRRAFPQFKVVPLRGNADTRVAKVDSGEVDAAILSYAGLKRIGLDGRVTDVLEPDLMLPAVGQGAVGIECRADDAEAMRVLSLINHELTFICVCIERAMLRLLQGSCHTPIGGMARRDGGDMVFEAMVASVDGKNILHAAAQAPLEESAGLGKAVADELLAKGAGQLLKEAADA